jgi:hypothetical protein
MFLDGICSKFFLIVEIFCHFAKDVFKNEYIVTNSIFSWKHSFKKLQNIATIA